MYEINERKRLVLVHYSNGSMSCAKCGFENATALTIDHINGNGAEHRRNITGNFYQWLIKNDYPDGFQVLCMNCQWIKRIENGEGLGEKTKERTKLVKKRYGRSCFHEWGKNGGNPTLIQQGIDRREKEALSH